MGWFSGLTKHLPLASGPYVPGMVDLMLNYGKESSLVRLYYPSEQNPEERVSNNRWKTWIPDDSYLYGISKVLMLYPFVLRCVCWWSEHIVIPAVYGAKIKINNNKLKCIVLSHGLGGNRFLYSNICCELASRGFLILALEHRDNSACNTFYYATRSDAEVDLRTHVEFKHVKLGREHHKTRNEQVKIRYSECAKVLDFLKQLHQGIIPHNVLDDTPLHKDLGYDFDLKDLGGNLDMNNLCLMGHSFGAATTLYTLSKITEFRFGILLDPWMFPVKSEHLEEKVQQPLLFINTQTFHIAANVEAMSKLLHASETRRIMYTIKHTTHESQTDSVLLIGYWLNWFMKKLNPLQALKINNALILTYLHKEISFPVNVGDCEALLRKEMGNFEEGLTKPWA
ncbi:platelet-activating factor acetylhydrolase-like [Rhynchophorus ferrugineus]|uniref:platelet-activating factor acetylhydrolase-like n=1 Tax=Rhynchophorus ferrugineus TaxID=354439 RepID=UPI003FCE9075